MYLGIDIGATKIAAGLVESGESLLSYEVTPTPQSADDEEVFDAVRTLSVLVMRSAGIHQVKLSAIGIGCPGPIIYANGEVSPVLIPAWRSFPLRQRMKREFDCPVVIDIDAKAFTLAEAKYGAGQTARCVLGIVVSTGVGGGIAVNGKLLNGASGNAGHIGHMLVDPYGPLCPRLVAGCLTAISSGHGIVKRALHALNTGHHTLLRSLGHNQITAKDVAIAACQGDALAIQLLQEAGIGLGRAIISAAHLLDPDCVVIGGGVSDSGEVFWTALYEEVQLRQCLEFTRTLSIVPAKLGRLAGVIGAAALVNE